MRTPTPHGPLAPPGISCGHSGCGTAACTLLGQTYVQASFGGSCEPGSRSCSLLGPQVTLTLINFKCSMSTVGCPMGQFVCLWAQTGTTRYQVTDCKS
jgi:hypothetical protein